MQLKILGLQGSQNIDLLTTATAKMTLQDAAAVLTKSALTKELQEQILVANGATAEEAEIALATAAHSAANITATSTTKSLNAATKGLWATLKSHPFVLIAAAAVAVIAVFEKLHVTAKEANEKMRESFGSYDEAKNKVEGINKEIEETSSKIDALEEKESLTIVEQNELDKLKEVNEQLLIQQDLREREANRKAREAAEDAVDAYNKNFKNEISSDKTKEYQKQAAATGNNAGLLTDDTDISAQIATLNQIKELQNEAEKEYRQAKAENDEDQIARWGKEIQRYDNMYGDIKDSIFEQVQSLMEYRDILSQLPEEELSKVDGGQELLDKINEQVKYIYSELDPVKWNNIQFDSVLKDEDFSKAKKELEDLANASNGVGITVDTVREKYPELAKAIDDAGLSVKDFVNTINSGMTSSGDSVASVTEKISDSAKEMAAKTAGILSGIGSAQEVLSSQSTGKSISLDDFNSEELKDYASALEYTNGALQLNADKVNELIKVKTKEQIAVNDSNKAIAQSKYLENVAEIEGLRRELSGLRTYDTYARDERQSRIDGLLKENEAIRETCYQYDLMSDSLREATGAYQSWINSQGASQKGDMFDGTIEALNHVSNTLNNKDSDLFGRVGRTDYEAAIKLIVPDSVDAEDADKVNSYLDSIYELFTYDESGNYAGLNIENFCKEAVDSGLMVLDEATESYQIVGQKTMEDFAKGMGLSLPLVQAMFGEMEEFGGEFSWADEANKTIGDLAVSADVAAEKLRELNPDLTLELDVSHIENADDKVSALDKTISQMQDLKIDADTEEIEYANSIISYCVTQKQELENPAILNIDTSKLSDDAAEAVALIQEFKTAYNDLELQKSLGLDTTEAQGKVDSLTQQLSSSKNDYIVSLKLDSASAESLNQSIVDLQTPEILTTFKIDETALLDYQPESKDAVVTYDIDTSVVDAYNPKNLSRYVNYYVRTIGSVGGGSSVRGVSRVSGTAMANGNWGTKTAGETLVGEVGNEIVVDGRSGRWYTVGDYGAEFTDIPKGAIVFNHEQTKALLKNGRVSGRGKALVGGTAMVSGGIKFDNVSAGSSSGGNSTSNYRKPSNSAKNSTSSKPKSSNKSKPSNDSAELEEKLETLNWIEIAISRIERVIDRLKTTATSAYKALSTKLGATRDEIAMVNKELSIQQKAYDRYIQEANSVGLSSDLAELVRNGAIDISEYDEDTQELIQDYQKWYDAALECDDAIQQLSEDLASMYEDSFNDTKDDFDNRLDLLGHLTNSYKNSIDKLETQGYLASTKAYAALQDVEKENISTLNSELSALEKSFSEAMNSGEIEKYSESWYSMQMTINEVKEEIDEANLSLIEYDKTMRELEWSYFDYVQDRIAQITKESDFLVELMSNSDLHTDKGQLTDTGMATMGLHGMNYNTYMAQADQYASEVLEINDKLAKDPNNTELIARKEELLGLQQDSILAAEQEKNAIVDLVEEGIQLELNHLKELIDTYNDALDSAKNLYDYQKKIQDHTSEISSLEKQMSAYQNDFSEEAQAKIQKIQIELKQAKENLEETEYQQYVSDQKKLLDDLYLEYETVLNQRLDNVDALIEDMIGTVNTNTDSINATLTEVANDVGYTITDNLSNVWNGSTDSINGTLSVYGDGFSEKLTAINNVLSQIQANVSSMISASEEQAQADIDSTESVTIPDSTLSQNPSTPEDSQTHSQEKEISVGGKIDASGAKIYSYAGDNTGEHQYYANDPIYTVLGESNGYVRVRWHKLSSGVTGWFKKNDVKAYKTGGLVDYTGLAQLDGTPSKPELVLNSRDTENFINLNDALRKIAARGISMDTGYSNIQVPNLTEITDVAKGLERVFESVNVNSGTSFGDISINIPIEHVEDYNDFISRFQNDKDIERLVQSMTVDRLAGGRRLSKYSFQIGRK